MPKMIGLETGEFANREARCPNCGSWAIKWVGKLNEGAGAWACFDCPWDDTWEGGEDETLNVERATDDQSS